MRVSVSGNPWMRFGSSWLLMNAHREEVRATAAEDLEGGAHGWPAKGVDDLITVLDAVLNLYQLMRANERGKVPRAAIAAASDELWETLERNDAGPRRTCERSPAPGHPLRIMDCWEGGMPNAASIFERLWLAGLLADMIGALDRCGPDDVGECASCGGLYRRKRKRPGAAYCSDACRAKARRVREKESGNR